MRALLSKQEEPSLYQSIGNYFSHILRSNLSSPEQRPKVHFALFLKTRISTNEVHVSSEFSSFFAQIWQECCPIMWQKNSVGELLFLASFESNEYFHVSKGTACFIKTQSLTAY